MSLYQVPREATLVRIKTQQDAVTGIALSATLGLGIGVMAGMILGELLGDVHPERVRGAVGRLRPAGGDETDEPEIIEQAIIEAIEDAVPGAAVTAQALGNGIIELTGSAPDAASRQLAGRIAQGMPNADVVVNRIQVVDDGDHAGRRSSPVG